MFYFLSRHVGKVVVVVAVLFVILILFVTQTINTTESARQGSKYVDDGKGLVYVDGNEQSIIFRNLQSWRDNHPDRFKRVINIAVSSYWSGAIVVYNPDTTAARR